MSLTASTMMELGTEISSFALPDVRTGKIVRVPEQGPVLIMFICNHCPYVIHVKSELARIGRDYAGKVAIIAISSNDVAYAAEDSPEKLKEMAEALSLSFPLCYDESQDVALSFTAACTPDIFLFDKDRRLAYRGQIDGSRPGNTVPVDGRDLRAAMDALLKGGRPLADQRPATGCNIKWQPGKQPAYYCALVNKK
jgi:thiol-disulfide isomerase/thioredoxin